jgi:glycosyltransferase involved in cell wall biosynthesis
MLVENNFPQDTRVRNEAFTLAEDGFAVTVIALRAPGQKQHEIVRGVSVYRIPRLTLFKKLPRTPSASWLQARLNKLRTVVGYVSEYAYFTSACLFVSLYVAVTDGVDVVHAHNPPDTLFIVGAVHKLLGKKFVFDHHDLSPELYRSRYKTGGGLVARVLQLFETLSVKLADVLIATNESYRAIDIERSHIDPDKVFVVRNGPDLSRVRLVEPDPVLKDSGKTILGYVGAMNPQDGVDHLLGALSHLRHVLHRTDFYCVLVGDGDSREGLVALADELGIADQVRFTGFIPDEDLVRYLSTSDISLDPNPSSPLNDVSTWIKVMEYMALSKPVISFDLKETRTSAGPAALYVTPNDEAQFAVAIAQLMDDPVERSRMGACGRMRVETEFGWHITSKNLLAAYDHLFARVPRHRVGHAQVA